MLHVTCHPRMSDLEPGVRSAGVGGERQGQLPAPGPALSPGLCPAARQPSLEVAGVLQGNCNGQYHCPGHDHCLAYCISWTSSCGCRWGRGSQWSCSLAHNASGGSAHPGWPHTQGAAQRGEQKGEPDSPVTCLIRACYQRMHRHGFLEI